MKQSGPELQRNVKGFDILLGLFSFTTLQIQCWPPESQQANTTKRVCVHCVFETHTHSVSMRKLSL